MVRTYHSSLSGEIPAALAREIAADNRARLKRGGKGGKKKKKERVKVRKQHPLHRLTEQVKGVMGGRRYCCMLILEV